MAEETAISWCDHTFNPWWGCAKVSAECTNCYAESFDKRIGGKHWGANSERRFFGDKHWAEPLKWNKAAERDGVRRRVFCASMADVFENRQDLDESRTRLWWLISMTPNLDWLLLTKRPEAAMVMLPWTNPDALREPLCRDCADSDGMCMNQPSRPCDSREPWPNVWLGTTCGVRESLSRVSYLRTIPAAVRFISCEPILEYITAHDWDAALGPASDYYGEDMDVPPIHWLIVGNESGPKRRPALLDWVRVARDAAAYHGVAFHFKQWVEPNGKKVHLPILDGAEHAAFPTP